jgi:hypothetical protein
VPANNNNKRVRRAIAEILFKHGPLSRDRVGEYLKDYRGIKSLPSPNTLSALMSKNPQVIEVGREKVELTNGLKTYHLLFDVDRDIVLALDDLKYTQPMSMMSPSERRNAVKCEECGRARLIRDGAVCLPCLRTSI